MKLDIAHLALRLSDVPPDLGARVTALLEPALQRRLSRLAPRDGGGAHDTTRDIARLDLGRIEAPAGAGPAILSELIAAQLVGWIEREGH